MLSQDFNYNVIVTPDRRSGTGELCYSVQCPALGLADEGETIDEALKNIKQLVTFHLQSIAAEGEVIEDEANERSLLTSVRVSFQPNV